jgi:superfamily II DNA/RNA helicase
VVVATPGRLIDLIERKAINLAEILYVVLDEADEMLNMGFREDIEFILQNTPKRNCTWLFSATMPREVRDVSRRFMRTPVEVSIGKLESANVNIDHQYYVTAHVNRYQALKRIIDFNPGIYGIVHADEGRRPVRHRGPHPGRLRHRSPARRPQPGSARQGDGALPGEEPADRRRHRRGGTRHRR